MAPEEVAPTSDRTRVLIIDDAPDVHRLLKHKLRNEELEFVSAHDGMTGLRLARTAQPSAIILDLDMPGLSGLGVLRTLKSADETQQIPVMMLARVRSQDEKVQAFEMGAADFISKPFEFTELRVRLLSILRTHRLMVLLAQRAQVDGLTGLWNRSFFESRWRQEHARNIRQGHPLSVAMFDLDFFKRINDTHGHAAGDSVLMVLGRLLQRESRQSDLTCRYGGEEFLMIMPDTGPEDAALVCDRIRTAVAGMTWDFASDLTVTISIGIAGCEGPGALDADAWFRAADANLYQAKRSGRDRIVATHIPRLDRNAPRLAG